MKPKKLPKTTVVAYTEDRECFLR